MIFYACTAWQLPKALQLPWDPDTQQLNLGALAAAIPSRLLVSLLAAAASPAVVASAQQVLGWLDVKAAAKNNYLGLFKSEERFPEVRTCASCMCCCSVPLHREIITCSFSSPCCWQGCFGLP